MRRRGRLAMLAVAGTFVGFAGVGAVRLGIAGDARHAIESRHALALGGYATLGAEEVAAAREALSLDEGDPTLHEMVAFGDANARRDPAGVTAHLKSSIALRPVSPYAWAALEADRYQAGAPVPDLERLLLNAALLGPSEPPV